MKAKYFLFSFFFFGIVSAIAQDFNGIATYKTHRSVDLKMDSTQMNVEMQASLQAQLRKQFQKEYTLSFTPSESIYKEIEKLDTPAPSLGGGITITVGGLSDVLYKNLKNSQYARQTEFIGKEFLVKDSLAVEDWVLEKESKNIGEYICFKATLTKEVTEETYNSELEDIEMVTKTRVTTAWYTPQIPVQNGPEMYGGLPGLILEISEGDYSILCTRVTLNPKEPLKIEVPKKGKEISQTKFDVIKKEKSRESIEMMKSNRKSNDGKSFSIKIGG
ncbi:GLPGLI family protein [Cochleicola gelatinilyticus]|uniref:GLPGLI family protein n=1 Tax=Cochleicola gelatinilyticus TaxID=1763537 RepID=A0A167IJF1_9FLAO|nr:GLPGLI family protein [Cochleicola gelatinilyticus]OAB79716.1 hypothetical protein ULVI_02940 [Cochleicola gelatinilyticus]